MKTKLISVVLACVFCFLLTACADSEPKRPIDYPDSKWTCDAENITFSVSDDGKITDASVIDINGEKVEISFVFSDISEAKVSITNADGSETYITGGCTYGDESFHIFVTDVYNSELGITSAKLSFERD